jgi:hypothetical protein
MWSPDSTPVDVTILGSRRYADTIKLRQGHHRLCPNPMLLLPWQEEGNLVGKVAHTSNPSTPLRVLDLAEWGRGLSSAQGQPDLSQKWKEKKREIWTQVHRGWGVTVWRQWVGRRLQAKSEWCDHKPRNDWSPPILQRWAGSSVEVSEGAWLCQYLGFGFLPSTTVRI